MKKVIRLSESDLRRIVKKVLIEQGSSFGVQDNKRVKSDLSQNLTPQGCAQVNYLSDYVDKIEKGKCFTKNTKPLHQLKPRRGVANLHGEYWNEIKNSIPNVFLNLGEFRNMIFYCDKNKSPMEDKSNIIIFSAEHVGKNNYRGEFTPRYSKPLEIALQKHFCKKDY